MDNLYRVTVAHSEDGLGEDTFHVLAPSAKTAVAKAFRKYNRRHPGHGELTLHFLELVEEDFQ